MKVKNTIFKSIDDLQKFIEENHLKSATTLLVQVFFGTVDLKHIQLVLGQIEASLPDATIIGASTDGEILDQQISVGETVISFSIFENSSIYPYSFPSSDRQANIGALLGEAAVEKNAKMMILFGDSLSTNGDQLLEEIGKVAPNVIVVGGLAGDNGNYLNTVVVCGQSIQTSGVVAVMVVSDSLRVMTKYSFNWIPIGPSFTVTKSVLNRVYELDYTPTLRLYAEYLGDSIAEGMPSVGSEFPLIMYHNGMQYGRSCVCKHDDGSLSFSGNVPKGAMVQFGIGNIDMIIESSGLLPTEISPFEPEAIFVYSSMARRRFLGQNADAEIAPLAAVAPTTGFFTYGEFFTDCIERRKQFFNNVISVVGLSEAPLKLDAHDKNIANGVIKRDDAFGKTFKALSHLINKTSIDLQVLNDSLRRRIDQEVQKNREKDKMMIAQSKQATMGEMISMIAHQWRQPITSIGLLSSSMRLDAEFDDLKKNDVISITTQIDDQVQYLSRTIDDFRNYFKPNKMSEKFELKTLFKEVGSMSSHFLDSNGIKLEIYSGEDLAIKSLKSELMQVMVNIVNNAKDALLERKVQNPVIKLEATLDHKGVIVVIKDNAGGIKEDVAERVFEPYFSTKSAKNGTGLGLYMAKTIIEEHLKGVISTFNDEEGAIFVLKLPFELKDEM